MRRNALIALVGFSALAQAPLRPSFEVATIKLNQNCGGRVGRGRGLSPNGYTTSCAPLRVLIRLAYGLPGYSIINPRQIEVVGGPSWLDSDLYDITAKGNNSGSLEAVKPMLRTLLEDRCKLKVHKESKMVPIYVLTVAKGGPKIKPPKEGSCLPNIIINSAPPPSDVPALVPCLWTSSIVNGGNTVKTGLGVTMDQFAIGMLATLDRPVVNRTGLEGMFYIHLEYATDVVGGGNDSASATVGEAPTPSGPSIFSAIQDQLGLKLSPDRGSVDTLVIDSVERPSEN